MSVQPNIPPDNERLTISVPLQFRRRGGRKQVVTPEGASLSFRMEVIVNNTLVKAIARAHRWERMLESGRYGSIAELATEEEINPSYLARILRLTLLSPEIVERILDGEAPQVTLGEAVKQLPIEWEGQLQGAALCQKQK